MFVRLLKAIKLRLEQKEKLQIDIKQNEPISFSDYLLNMILENRGNKK